MDLPFKIHSVAIYTWKVFDDEVFYGLEDLFKKKSMMVRIFMI